MAKRFSSQADREKHILDFVNATVRSSEDETIPDRHRWKLNESLFAGKMDWDEETNEEDWRAKLFIHEFAPIVREAATSAINQILSRSDFMNFLTDQIENKEFATIIEKLERHYLNDMGFTQKFYEWCLVGGIYGFATWRVAIENRLVWEPKAIIERTAKATERAMKGVKATNKPSVILPDSLDEVEMGLMQAAEGLFGISTGATRKFKPQKKLELGFDLAVVNPFNYFWNPDVSDINDSSWHAERSYRKFCDVARYFDDGTFNKDYRKNLLSKSKSMPYGTTSSADSYQQQKLRQRDQYNSNSAYFPTVELVEYYGPLLDRDGDVLEDVCHFIIGNGSYVLTDRPILNWNQKHPYRTAIFSRRPFKPTGAGIADGAVAGQILINEFISLFADALRMDVYSPMAVNYDMLAEPTQIEGGIRPRDCIKIFNGKASDAFSGLPRASDVAPKLFETLEFIKLAGQKSSAVNTMTSNPASRARISAAEVQSNDTRRLESLNSLGFEIDVNGIEPVIHTVKNLIVQFGFDQENLNLLTTKGILTESENQYMQNLTTVQRYEESIKSLKMEIRGFRAAMERQQWLMRSSELIQQINQMPDFVKMEKVQWDGMLYDIVEAYGFKPEKWLRQADQRDTAREENSLLQLGKMISVIGEDDDAAHLPVHYEALMKFGPIPTLVQHSQMHMMKAQSMGAQLPPPPPEVAGMLGLPPPETPEKAQQQAVADRIGGKGSQSKTLMQ